MHPMTLPMILTWGRIAIAPLFFLFYELAEAYGAALLIPVWATFLLIEVSDLLDGHFARIWKQESDIGKILDPFADSLSRLTYFVAFAGTGILPLWILLILIYRDVAVAYIRVMVSKSQVLMPARTSGKLKAWIYAFAGGVGIAVFSVRKLGLFLDYMPIIQGIAFVLFVLAALVALWSLADYAAFFMKNFRKPS
jgi:CDP-diacylglycerol--glycerol-3-phosphate 3-phosphatidyltransferase